jgi:hypothetical protein
MWTVSHKFKSCARWHMMYQLADVVCFENDSVHNLQIRASLRGVDGYVKHHPDRGVLWTRVSVRIRSVSFAYGEVCFVFERVVLRRRDNHPARLLVGRWIPQDEIFSSGFRLIVAVKGLLAIAGPSIETFLESEIPTSNLLVHPS